MAEDPVFPGGILVRRLIEMIPFALVIGALMYFKVGSLETDVHAIKDNLVAGDKAMLEMTANLRAFTSEVSNAAKLRMVVVEQKHDEFQRRIENLEVKILTLEEQIDVINMDLNKMHLTDPRYRNQ